MSRVAVVGGGVAGLAAAWDLVSSGSDDAADAEGLEVVVLEGSSQVGGKLRTAPVAGLAVDVGAESMLARRPEALTLLADVGLQGKIVHPSGATATIWSRGRRWPLPQRTLMGIPSDPDTVLGILRPDEVARVRAEVPTPPLESDVSVGELIEARLGPAVVDRLVEPLLAGVYAGHARRLSLQASVPALWAAARRGEPLVTAAARAASSVAALADSGQTTPVFAGYRGGLGSMMVDLAARLAEQGVVVRAGSPVRALTRTSTGWALTVGPTTAAERLEADAVVLATPGAPTARLLVDHAPYAASVLGELDYASMAIVTLALPRVAIAPLGTGSGFLVPPTEPVTIKAATATSAKWRWVDDLDLDVVLLRTSIGRAGETADLQRDDADLVRVALRDLGVVFETSLPAPVDSHVQRWGGALPQYAVGHLDRVEGVMRDVEALPGVELAGAAYGGLGVAASIASGRSAAARVLTHLRERPPAWTRMRP